MLENNKLEKKLFVQLNSILHYYLEHKISEEMLILLLSNWRDVWLEIDSDVKTRKHSLFYPKTEDDYKSGNPIWDFDNLHSFADGFFYNYVVRKDVSSEKYQSDLNELKQYVSQLSNVLGHIFDEKE